jgi:hypothetical protein
LDLDCEHVDGADRMTELARGCDVLVGVADEPVRHVRHWMVQASLRLRVPAVQAGGGRIGPFHLPGASSCFGFLEASQMEALGLAPDDADTVAALTRFRLVPPSALVPQPAAFSALLVMDIVRHLSGIAQPATVGRVLTMGPNLLDGRLDPVPQRADCIDRCT